MSAPENCLHCGESIPRNARCCPGCGADESTGWGEESVVGRLGLSDDSFDYDAFAEEEFGERKPSVRPQGISWWWWLVAVLILVGFVWTFLVRR